MVVAVVDGAVVVVAVVVAAAPVADPAAGAEAVPVQPASDAGKYSPSDCSMVTPEKKKIRFVFPLSTPRPTTAMPPKAAAPVDRVMLGRPSNNLRAGIVGLPNVGKSSLFNTLTNSATAAENYPFCTIGNPQCVPFCLVNLDNYRAETDPSEARCAVPDERFDWLCDVYKPASKVMDECTSFFSLHGGHLGADKWLLVFSFRSPPT